MNQQINPAPNPAHLERAYQTALAALLAERRPEGYWVGELSTSALSTATAVSALAMVQRHTAPPTRFERLIADGLSWLDQHQNADGGWGDTVKSFSNISTTMLCRSAYHIAGAATQFEPCLQRANAYLQERFGTTPAEQAEGVRARYGKDRTFAVPILVTAALAGLVSWKEVAPLPFELACLPQSWFRFLRLHVVSYALPALIAIGQAVYHHRRPQNPLAWAVRRAARRRSLRVLERLQPSSGGFLEATPLTSFVVLSLASIGHADHVVSRKGVAFLVNSVRRDGSWPIDSNLATWVTTLSVSALAAAGELGSVGKLQDVYRWLTQQQFAEPHPYTGAAPGGFAWTPLPGGVPDADDTPGAVLALKHIERQSQILSSDAWHDWGRARNWIIGLQNRDGGWPTFCRGWGALPFDRSGTDLTAHNIRALAALSVFPDGCLNRIHFERLYGPKVDRGFAYLARQQRPDGSWVPLWFGNQHAPDEENPTYGTARVLAAYRDLDMMNTDPARRGVAWLIAAQNSDGGWGGGRGTPSSVEESALAVEVLLDAGPEAEAALNKGLAWLVEQVEAGRLHDPAPIGFYFAKLWYFERLYPLAFTVAALGRARKKLSGRRDPPCPDRAP